MRALSPPPPSALPAGLHFTARASVWASPKASACIAKHMTGTGAGFEKTEGALHMSFARATPPRTHAPLFSIGLT
jgi:hypothetical protein